jgi:hypothetical protein
LRGLGENSPLPDEGVLRPFLPQENAMEKVYGAKRYENWHMLQVFTRNSLLEVLNG